MIEYVETPKSKPIETPCVVWSQVQPDQHGSDPPPIYSAPCPKCQPRLKLPEQDKLPHDDKQALIEIMRHLRIHLADYGCIVCSCGAYVKLVPSSK